MKRQYLEGLGLEKSVIDQIMTENGNDIEKAKASFATERDQLNERINDLTGQIASRDEDLKTLNATLESAKADAGKLTEAQNSLTELQTKYDNDKTAWEQKSAQQAYEFAVKTEVGKLHFSSGAARKDFTREAIAKGMQMEGDTILGFNDFVSAYKEQDPEAFVKVAGSGAELEGGEQKPAIVMPKGTDPKASANVFGFNFSGVRPAPKE